MSAHVRLLAILCIAAFAWGCDSVSQDPSPNATPAATAADVLQLDGYTVEYLPGADGATFTYRVSGSGNAANLNYVFLETACAEDPASLSPSNAVSPSTNTEADTTLSGVQWNQGLGEDGSRDYAVTYGTPQDVGAVMVVIKSGNDVQSGLIAGACGNLFDLGGSVFVNDGDDDGSAREATELGIQDVRVEIFHDDGSLATSVVSGPDGRFSARLLRGTYTVNVPDAAADAFNGTLETSYNYAAGATASRTVVLDADVSGTDFGYNPDKEVILDQLSDEGEFVTNGEEIKIWKRWVDKTKRGQTTASGITPDEMRGYLDSIFASPGESEDGYFGNAVPYELDAGADPFAAASAILGTKLNNRSTDAEVLYVEVFAMQLNFLSGRGSGNDLYDETLIEYFEATLGLDASGAAPRTAPSSDTALMASAVAIGSLDTAIAGRFNGGGGGGQVGD